MRPRLLVALLVVLGLGLGDLGQRWLFVQGAPALHDQGDWAGPGERLILVEGPTLDREEAAACRRDLAFAAQALGSPRQRYVSPNQTAEALWQDLAAAGREDPVVVYLSGHGGGRNFGAGRFNLTGETLAHGLSRLSCRSLLVVLDCCWSGEFQRVFAPHKFATSCQLVTSTDADHMAPFPTSFLAPRSFGQAFFADYARLKEARATVEATNRARRPLAWLYPRVIGLEGQWGSYSDGLEGAASLRPLEGLAKPK